MNYWAFRHALGDVGLKTIELSFDDHFEIPDAIHVSGGPQNILWQKERLLNLLIEQSTDNAFAWIDADLIFENRDWHKETLAKLDEYPVVQLFDTAHVSNSHGFDTFRSAAFEHQQGKIKHGKPGYAWAARSEAIPGGLMDRHITGGGDLLMLYAWLGAWQNWLRPKINELWAEHWLKTAAPYFRKVRGKIGYTSGAIHHLYHGSLQNRRYGARNKYLAEHEYNPEKDIELDENGLWRWATDKPEMHQAIANYFKERAEDDA